MNKLLTLCLASMAAATATAQVVRIDVDFIDNMGKVPGDTYRVYAVMQNEGDILDAVYGEASAPLKIASTAPFTATPKVVHCPPTFSVTTPLKMRRCFTIRG